MSEKIDIYPYKRAEGAAYANRKKRKKGGFKLINPLNFFAGMFSPGVLLAGAAAFFLGRAVFLGELIPFAVSFAAAVAFFYGRQGIPAIVMLVAGVATVTDRYGLGVYIVLIISVFLVVQAVPPRYSARKTVIPLLVFGLTISIKSCFLAFNGSSPYDYISVFFEGILAAVLALACMVSFPSVRKINRVKPMNVEEMACLLALLAGIIAGTGDLQLWYVSVKGLLSRLIILLAAYAGGAGLGAVAGALLGIIPALSFTVTPALMGAYSFSGVAAGLGKVLGKIGVLISFLAANIILSIYYNNFTGMEAVVAETALAGTFFLLIPAGFARGFSVAVRETAEVKPDRSEEALRDAFKEKLNHFALIFRELSSSFAETAVFAEKEENEQGFRQLLGDIRKKVCDGCSMLELCWEKDYYRIYQNMVEVFALVEVRKRVRAVDMPEGLKLRCNRIRELAITSTCLYEVFKVDKYWRRKLTTGREVIGEQLRGMASVIDRMSSEFSFGLEGCFNLDVLIKQKLRQAGLPVKEISVTESGKRKEIFISMKGCYGELDCRYKVAPLVSDFLGQVYTAGGCICQGLRSDEICGFRLYQCPNYRLEAAVAQAGRDGSGVSGDTYDFIQLKDGKVAAVLSDGMGSGEGAARQSKSVTGLLRRMLEAGMDIETSIKTMNSIQSLKNPGESFATMDISIIDLYEGQAEFIKIAAQPTFLIRGGRIRTFRTNSLPVGILSNIEIFVTEKKLNAGDVIVMITDGIIHFHQGEEDSEEWITGVLKELSGLDPRELAELLLKSAQAGADGRLRTEDDMSVLVLRVEKEKVVEIPR